MAYETPDALEAVGFSRIAMCDSPGAVTIAIAIMVTEETVIDDIVDEIRRLHYPGVTGSGEFVRAFEEKNGYCLPSDMKRFYERFNGARLFGQPNTPYWILPLERVEPAWVKIFGPDSDEDAPAAWFAFCDVQDGNYAAADLSSVVGCRCDIRDCFHETFPEGAKTIASSFTEFMQAALKSPEGEFWL